MRSLGSCVSLCDTVRRLPSAAHQYDVSIVDFYALFGSPLEPWPVHRLGVPSRANPCMLQAESGTLVHGLPLAPLDLLQSTPV